MNAIRPAEHIMGRFAAPAEVPFAAIPLQQQFNPWMDRKLGYFGNARFVCFYYEPRGEEVIWKDGQSYGFACGGWSYFADYVAPLADRHEVTVGQSGSAARQVLLMDRIDHAAWFMDRSAADQFLTLQHEAA